MRVPAQLRKARKLIVPADEWAVNVTVNAHTSDVR
jgi:hypothetical protein